MKFIHAADLHLDSPLRNLERYDGAPVDALRGATRRALENLVTFAIREQVKLVLLAGDLYDGDWRDYNTGLFFHHQLAKFREANIQVVWLCGNHDAASEITKTLRSVARLPNVQRLAESAPQTVYLNLDGQDVAIHGQGFLNKAVKDNLAATYPAAVRGIFNIGMLHTSLDGRPGHDNYAPCQFNDLVSKGYDYFALGHIHKHEVISREPWIAYSGNIQGRHVGESGVKGCLLITVENTKIIDDKFVDLDVLRWRQCKVDVSGAEDEDAVLEKVSAQLLSENVARELPEAVRLNITGSCKAHAALHRRTVHWIQELRAQVTNLSNGRIWLEKIHFHTQDVDVLSALKYNTNGLDELLQTINSLNPEHPLLQQLEKDRNALLAQLPSEFKHEDWLQIKRPAVIAALQEDLMRIVGAANWF